MHLVHEVTPAARADGPDEAMPLSATFNVPPGHPVMLGHYPGKPVVPGTCLLDAALQAIELAEPPQERHDFGLLQVLGAQFLHVVAPGDPIELALSRSLRPASGASTWRASFASRGRQFARASLCFGPASADPPDERPSLHVTPAWTVLDAHGVARLLPHRSPLLLVDAACLAPDGMSLVATRAVSLADSCYAGLPPVADGRWLDYPALLATESFAQAAGLLLGGARGTGVPLLGGIRQVDFHRPARPGESLRHEVHLRRAFAKAALVEGTTFCGHTLVSRTYDLLACVVSSRAAEPGCDCAFA